MTLRTWKARIIACAALAAAPAHALIFDFDDRTFAPPGDKRFQPIGIVKSAYGYGTGFLVDDCHVLTSRHLQSEQGNFTGAELSFTPRNRAIGVKRGRAVAWGPAGIGDEGQTSRDRSGDWLLFKLNECVGTTLGFIALAKEPPGPELKLMNAGYPHDRARRSGLTIDPSCRIHFIAQIGSLNDCAFLPGNSGGPIFAADYEGGQSFLRAVAIGSAGYRELEVLAFDSNRANVATSITPILPMLRKHLRPVFRGTTQSDAFNGSGLIDRLEGRAGGDKFNLDQWGGDTIVGGDGADTYIVNPATGSGHFIADFNANEGDVLDLTSFGASSGRRGSVKIDCDVPTNKTIVRITFTNPTSKSSQKVYEVVLNSCSNSRAIVGLTGTS